MRVTYIKLENYAALFVGMNRYSIEINLPDNGNKIVSIQGVNGAGKTALLSAITPFANVPSIDERSSLPLVIIGKDGYKEIHYETDNGVKFIIKHYFKSVKKTHSMKSYISMNGEELNENGNVTSFLSLIEVHFGIKQDTMRLIRLGSNVNSFITLTPARRKEYIGRLIEEIDLYLKIFKKVNDDLRVLKVLISANSRNLYNCHISDLVLEKDTLRKLNKRVKKLETERDGLVSRIGMIETLERENNVVELRNKMQEAKTSLSELSKIEDSIKSSSLINITIDVLITNRTNVLNSRIEVQSKINSYRISIDNLLKSIERIDTLIRRITSDNDIESLNVAIIDLEQGIKKTSILLKGFIKPSCTSDEVYRVITKLSSFNQISQMIYTFGKKSIDIYLELKNGSKSVDKFIKEQLKKSSTGVNDGDIQKLMSQLFQDDIAITPNCDTEYVDCPYYRLSETMNDIKDRLYDKTYDGETLRYVQVISNNIDNILNEIDTLRLIRIPDKLKDNMREKIILDRLGDRMQFFNLTDIQDYLSALREYEIYQENIKRLKEYKSRLSLYKSSGIDAQLAEIVQYKTDIEFYRKNIISLEKELQRVEKELILVDQNISLVSRYNDSIKYKSMMQSTLESTSKILGPLESSVQEKMECEFNLSRVEETIHNTRADSKSLENKIIEYERLLSEESRLDVKQNHLTMIMESVSTKKGIPVIYMKTYLGKIQKLANDLLSIIYDRNEFTLDKFKVTNDTFEIPYVQNGMKVVDAKCASQGEEALITMAISFALAHNLSGMYNILLLDEIDGGLDETNRYLFLDMLDKQMSELNAKQVFIISHNLNQMMNVPMDVIRLSNIGAISKLQTVIYE